MTTDYVTSFTPIFGSSCEAATFTHPVYKGAFGHPADYLVWYGPDEATAQAGQPVSIEPGEVLTYTFEDMYVDNQVYFELKLMYEGHTFQQKIGHRVVKSEACEKPVEEVPVEEQPEEPSEETPEESEEAVIIDTPETPAEAVALESVMVEPVPPVQVDAGVTADYAGLALVAAVAAAGVGLMVRRWVAGRVPRR